MNEQIPNNVVEAYEVVKEKGQKVGFSSLAYGAMRDRPPEWIILFEYYNSNNTKRLGMGCYGCYGKVFQFVGQKIREENGVGVTNKI